MLSNVTIFDFETTGLDPRKDQVIELAAIRVEDGEITSSFTTLIRFDGKLAPRITEITGITDDDLLHGKKESEAFETLRDLMGDSLLVAHNAAFDLQFLHHTLIRLGKETFSNPFIDTMTISRERHTYPHKLVDMCSRYGIDLDGAHRALNDVVGCWELLKQFHDRHPVDIFLNKLGYLRKYGAPEWAPSHAILFPTDNRYEKKSYGGAL